MTQWNVETLVRLRGVAKDYKRGAETVHVLHQLDLDIPKGDFLALMGPSGSGKSTLLNLIGGLDRPSAGTIEIAGQRTDSLSDGQLGKWRANHVGFVFQMYNLLPVLTAERNVELPLLLTSLSAGGPAQARQRCARPRRPGRAREAQAARAVGRSGAARRHRARDRLRSDAPAVRRADRRPRPQVGRRNPRPAAGAEPAAEQDHHHGDARSARRRARQARAASQQGTADHGSRGLA